jgi:multidrug efflux pump subunit AcrA (membrane-fusion protein)
MLMLAGLAMGAVGSIAGASAEASAAKAQAAQAEMNRQWQEFETQYNRTQQMGQMGLAEFDRQVAQQTGQKESLQMLLAQQRGARDQAMFQSQQFSRAYRQSKARLDGSMASRGTSRGGTAEALKRQSATDAANDSFRIRTNLGNQLDAFENQRNASLKQLFSQKVPAAPPTYFPSTPIPQPDTSGAMLGAVLSGIGSTIGGIAGANAAGSGIAPGSSESFNMAQMSMASIPMDLF